MPKDSLAPILVMEYVPLNLTSCIEKYGVMPAEISYSILYDVALGLCYLHSQVPPIIHRDSFSNNVFLDTNMKAKISDLSVARILNLSPFQASRMTQTPGTPAHMPPEQKHDNTTDDNNYCTRFRVGVCACIYMYIVTYNDTFAMNII